MNTKIRSMLFALFGATTLFLTACGGTDDTLNSDLTQSGDEFGELQIVLTDAEEDFLTYKVTVDSISLTRASGAKVDVLTTETSVDFVQYQELSELLAVRSIPAGRYESIEFNLDFTDSEIVVQDELGNAVLAEPVGADGAPLAEFSIELIFGDTETVFVSPARVAFLTLDFDLAASNEILSYDPAQVLVEPFLMATAEIDADREHRARGLLESVDTADQSFVLNIVPMRLRTGDFGEVTITVDSDTTYEIDDIEYQGDAGLDAMALLATGIPVVAFGSYDELNGATATTVLAGTSVAWADQDVLRGVITARDGNILSVAGAVLEISEGERSFVRNVQLSVGEDTTVTGYRLGDADIDSLSVGQRIFALGDIRIEELEQEDASTSSEVNFDATDGTVRMRLSNLIGQVVTASPLAVDIAFMNRRPISIFDFTDTGISPDFDADPLNYEIATMALDTTNIEDGEWIQVRGYPTAFGSAPDDYDAVSIIDYARDSFNSGLIVRWDAEADETILVEDAAITLELDEARLVFNVGNIPLALSQEFEISSIVGALNGGRYAVHVIGESISIYRSYGDFIVAVENQLALGTEATLLTARGDYNSINGELTAKNLIVKF